MSQEKKTWILQLGASNQTHDHTVSLTSVHTHTSMCTHTYMHIHRDRQTYRQAGRQAGTQADRQTDRQKQIDRQRHREGERERDGGGEREGGREGGRERERERETDRQTDRQTETETDRDRGLYTEQMWLGTSSCITVQYCRLFNWGLGFGFVYSFSIQLLSSLSASFCPIHLHGCFFSETLFTSWNSWSSLKEAKSLSLNNARTTKCHSQSNIKIVLTYR